MSAASEVEVRSDLTPPVGTLELAAPWRRFWARVADLWIGAFLVSTTLSSLAPALYVTVQSFPGGKHLLVMMMLPFVLALDAMSIAICGATPGKAVAGIKVRDMRGQRLSLATLIKRNIDVWLWGLGLGIPIVNLVAMWNSKQRLDIGVHTSWDEGAETRCFVQPDPTSRHGGPSRSLLSSSHVYLAITSTVPPPRRFSRRPSERCRLSHRRW